MPTTLQELSHPGGLPLLLLLLLFAVLATLLVRRLAPASFAALGPARIARGYAAVAAAAVALALMEALAQGRANVAQGHITTDQLGTWMAGSALYLFGLIFSLALALLATLIVPATVWLAGKQRATLPAVVGAGLAIAAVGAAWHAAFPSDAWSQAHRLGAALAFMSPVGTGIILLPLVFGMACQLPMQGTQSS